MATRFWVGGTGTWDAATTTHWGSATGVADNASVPGSSDTVTFDANSGGGTVTLNFGGTITIQSIAIGAFTGTFENSVNNNNMTMSGAAGFSGSGVGVRTIKLGTATYTLSSVSAGWTFSVTSNLTFLGSSANISFTGGAGNKQFNGGGLSHGNVTIGAAAGAGIFTISGASTFASLSIVAPNYVLFPFGVTNTISSAFTWAGSSSNQISLITTSAGTTATIAAAASSTATWTAFRDLTFTGSPTATDSFSLGNNSGITITRPGGAGSTIATGVIGS